MKNVAFHRTRLIAVVVAVCAATVIGAGPVSAGSATLTVNPTTVQAGGQIDVSEFCWSEVETVTVSVHEGWTDAWTTPETPAIVEQGGIVPDEADQWSATLTIPVGTPPGSYTVFGTCGERIYGAVELTVLASTATTTTTTMAPTTAGPTTTTAAPAPVAAAPVAAEPTYTG